MKGHRGQALTRGVSLFALAVVCSILPGSPANSASATAKPAGKCVSPERPATAHDPSTLTSAAAAAAERGFPDRRAAQPASRHQSASFIIKVYWNVVYADSTLDGGNIPDQTIDKQIEVLNQAFQSTNVAFHLASLDRVQNASWFNEAAPNSQSATDMKRKLRRGGAGDLNIYSVGLNNGMLGFGTYPDNYRTHPINDGVLISPRTLPGGTAPGHNEGKSLVHEVGHWVGLYNTFQGGCSAPGDYVDDTPPEAYPSWGCPAERDSCPSGGLDPIHNYMDNSEDRCRNQFTQGQATRLSQQLRQYRHL